MIITIDGLAGSGKSTVAKIIAKDLKILYLNTGLLYRSVAFSLINVGLASATEEEASKMAAEMDFVFSLDQNWGTTLKIQEGDGDTYSTQNPLLLSPQVSDLASKIAVYPKLRDILLDVQRLAAKTNDAIVEGRDSGSVVFPNADYKFFLMAAPSVRAKRRCIEMFGNNYTSSNFDNVLAQIQDRDFRDTEREIAPCKPTSDSLIIDSSDLDISQVVEAIKRHIDL